MQQESFLFFLFSFSSVSKMILLTVSTNLPTFLPLLRHVIRTFLDMVNGRIGRVLDLLRKANPNTRTFPHQSFPFIVILGSG